MRVEIAYDVYGPNVFLYECDYNVCRLIFQNNCHEVFNRVIDYTAIDNKKKYM